MIYNVLITITWGCKLNFEYVFGDGVTDIDLMYDELLREITCPLKIHLAIYLRSFFPHEF